MRCLIRWYNVMTCHHRNTTVTNSRAPDAIAATGKNVYKPVPYPCIRFRIRECLDCGERYGTAEVPISYMEDAHPCRKEMEMDIIKKIITALGD